MVVISEHNYVCVGVGIFFLRVYFDAGTLYDFFPFSFLHRQL